MSENNKLKMSKICMAGKENDTLVGMLSVKEPDTEIKFHASTPALLLPGTCKNLEIFQELK
jgi:hypothetical protein